MSIKQITPMKAVSDYLQKQIERKEKALVNVLQYVGESCIAEARDNGNYIDRTGNLRSSVGYVIVKDGRVLKKSAFDQVPPKDGQPAGGTYNGGKEGEKFARKAISRFPNGLALIVVAGMNYAAYVSAKRYNVLDSSERMAQRLVPSLLKQLGFTVK